MKSATQLAQVSSTPRFFYGWYIVGVGFLANVASSFALASTLSIFLKPLTAELGISRGVFSLLRSGEGIVGACLAPFVGTLVDRFGGRWLMAVGAAIVGVGYLILGHVDSFGQFAALRLSVITFGDALMGSMVVNVVISQWFVRRRGRALAFTSMGVGFAKVCMPVVAAWLLLTIGWRQTWVVFGMLTMALLVLPALFVVRRTPESMGLCPDGEAQLPLDNHSKLSASMSREFLSDDPTAIWTRAEAMRTSTFWLLVVTFGISSIGVTGLNLHVYPYVTDIGHSPVVAATVMSVIASMQLASPLAWGLAAERIDPRIAAMLRFVVQGVGLALAIDDKRSSMSLCWIFSLRHRPGRQHGVARYALGELFWPAVAWQNSRHGLADFASAGGRGTAVFRISVRSDGRLRRVFCAVRRRLDDVSVSQPYAEAAAESIVE